MFDCCFCHLILWTDLYSSDDFCDVYLYTVERMPQEVYVQHLL